MCLWRHLNDSDSELYGSVVSVLSVLFWDLQVTLWHTNVFAVRRRPTCRASARGSPQLLDILSFVRLKQTSSSSRGLTQPLFVRDLLASLSQLPEVSRRCTCGTSTSLWANSDNFWKLRSLSIHCLRFSRCARLCDNLLAVRDEMSVYCYPG